MGLIDFIKFHYTDKEGQHSKQEKTPFSHHEHNTQCSQTLLLYQPSSPIDLQFKNIHTGSISFFNYVDAYYPAHAATIWQPPKLV